MFLHSKPLLYILSASLANDYYAIRPIMFNSNYSNVWLDSIIQISGEDLKRNFIVSNLR